MHGSVKNLIERQDWNTIIIYLPQDKMLNRKILFELQKFLIFWSVVLVLKYKIKIIFNEQLSVCLLTDSFYLKSSADTSWFSQ